MAQVARGLRIADGTLHNWIKKHKGDGNEGNFVGIDYGVSEDMALYGLQKKIYDLEEENTILTKAVGIISKDKK